MEAEKAAQAEAPQAGKPSDDGKRERSTIEFPYMALSDAIAVAQGVHQTTGSSACQHDQLAAKLGLSMNSSGYRVRISTARMFGLIESDRSGTGGVRLTGLGQTIVDSSREREAKAKAFLKVPLYSKLYEHYRGKVLPPASALERELANLGVAQKQTDRARQAFERSAETAGFFEMGRDRLVPPGGIKDGPTSESKSEEKRNNGSGGGDDGNEPPKLDPIIKGLIDRLPKPGDVWADSERKLWLQILENSFKLVYRDKPSGPEDELKKILE